MSQQGLLLRVNMLWIFPLGPIVFALLAVVSFLLVRQSGLQRLPRLHLVPGLDTRGLAAIGVWASAALTALYWIFTYGPGLLPANLTLLLVVSDALTLLLLAALVLVVVKLWQARGDGESLSGIELVLAYTVTFLGIAGPAWMVASLASLKTGGF